MYFSLLADNFGLFGLCNRIHKQKKNWLQNLVWMVNGKFSRVRLTRDVGYNIVHMTPFSVKTAYPVWKPSQKWRNKKKCMSFLLRYFRSKNRQWFDLLWLVYHWNPYQLTESTYSIDISYVPAPGSHSSHNIFRMIDRKYWSPWWYYTSVRCT